MSTWKKEEVKLRKNIIEHITLIIHISVVARDI